MWRQGQALQTIDPPVVGRRINNRGRVVRKLVNVNPGLRANSSITFSYLKMFFTSNLWYSLRLLQLKTEGKTILTEHLTKKFQNRNQNSRQPWVILIGLRTTRSWFPKRLKIERGIIETGNFQPGSAKSSRTKFCYEFFTQISEHFRKYFRLHWVDHSDLGIIGYIFFLCSLLA